ncbi:MAG: hypothetical protein ABIP97_13285 [Chthoniobacterales bacterium]
MLTSGNPQAQCYALVGIQALDPAKFEKLSAAYFKKRTEVSTIHGCMSGKEPMSRILKEIKAGEYKPSDPAFARLTQAKQFVFGERGEAPDISQEQKDYNEILARPTALKDFQRLLLFENPHAQCYALQGIQVLDPGKFEKLSLRYAKDERLVTIRSGCELDKEPMTRIIKEIKAGKYKPKEKAKP